MTPRGVTAASVVVLPTDALERRSLVDGYGAAAVLILRLGVFYCGAHRRELVRLPGPQRRLGLRSGEIARPAQVYRRCHPRVVILLPNSAARGAQNGGKGRGGEQDAIPNATGIKMTVDGVIRAAFDGRLQVVRVCFVRRRLRCLTYLRRRRESRVRSSREMPVHSMTIR